MNPTDKKLLELRQLLSFGNTEERVAIYHGVAVPVVSAIVKLMANGELRTKAEITMLVKELAMNLNELSIVDVTLMQKIILNRLGFITYDISYEDMLNSVNTFTSFEDTFNFNKYFGQDEIDIVNKNIKLLQKAIFCTFKVLTIIMPERD